MHVFNYPPGLEEIYNNYYTRFKLAWVNYYHNSSSCYNTIYIQSCTKIELVAN